MRRAQQGDTVAADRGVVCGRIIEHRGAEDFLGLREAALEAKVGRPELRLVEVVRDRVPGDRVAETDTDMKLVVNEGLAGGVVERRLAAVGLELCQRQEPH